MLEAGSARQAVIYPEGITSGKVLEMQVLNTSPVESQYRTMLLSNL